MRRRPVPPLFLSLIAENAAGAPRFFLFFFHGRRALPLADGCDGLFSFLFLGVLVVQNRLRCETLPSSPLFSLFSRRGSGGPIYPPFFFLPQTAGNRPGSRGLFLSFPFFFFPIICEWGPGRSCTTLFFSLHSLRGRRSRAWSGYAQRLFFFPSFSFFSPLISGIGEPIRVLGQLLPSFFFSFSPALSRLGQANRGCDPKGLTPPLPPFFSSLCRPANRYLSEPPPTLPLPLFRKPSYKHIIPGIRRVPSFSFLFFPGPRPELMFSPSFF